MTIHVLFVQGGGDGVHDEWDNNIPPNPAVTPSFTGTLKQIVVASSR
jgi:hypothetical protein